MNDMTPSERYVQELFYTRYQIHLSKIDEAHGRDGKTPDFECVEHGRRVFVCELKDFEIVLPSKETGWEIKSYPDGTEEATRTSNAPNRVSRAIYAAYKQMENYSEPKVLVFLNYGWNLDVRDLEDTFRGFNAFSVGNIRYVNTYARRASEGVIKDIKRKIDLYIWIDAASKRVSIQEDQICFRNVAEAGRKLAFEYFGITE